jgi:hypothetical protein
MAISASTTIGEFVIKAATGLLIVAAAFLVLFMLGAAVTSNTETAIETFLSP